MKIFEKILKISSGIRKLHWLYLKVVLLFASITGIFLSLIMLLHNGRSNTSTIYLGVFFLLLSLYCFYQYVLFYSKSVLLVEVMLAGFAVITPLLYLTGPALYWYIRSILTDNFCLKRHDLWHLLPMIIFIAASVHYAFVSYGEKAEEAGEAINDLGYLHLYKASGLSEIFPGFAVFLSRPLLVFMYAVWSVILLLNYSYRTQLQNVFKKQRFMKKWLFCLLGFLLIFIISHIILVIKSYQIHSSLLFFTFNLVRIVSVTGLGGLLVSLFFFPSILYGLPQLPDSIAADNSVYEKKAELIENRSQFYEKDYLHFIDHSIYNSMMKHQPYLQQDCNLTYISKLTDIPPHHISYFFREVKKQHFNDYRNEWRVNHAKELIKEGKANEVTLEAIGILSGFSSRKAFFINFKNKEGVPPGEYASRFDGRSRQ